MKKRKLTPILGPMLKKIAPKIGARVIMEPEWNVVGQIIFKSGRKRYFRYSSIDLNTLGASEISRDKDYANFFMERMGYPIIRGKKFYSALWAKAIGSKQTIVKGYAYAKSLGFPVIVKPNSGSQGVGVALVHTKKEFYRAMNAIYRRDRVALVQVPLFGKDYRVVVLDDNIISAYQRLPLSVIGTGKKTIYQLLLQKQKAFIASSRDTRLKIDDPRIKEKLKHQGLTVDYIPRPQERVYLLDNANLSSGGDSVDVTKNIHPEFRKLAIRLTKDMGLRLCGVDLMIEDDISLAPKKGHYFILEINSAPGLDHYARSGKTQEKIVEKLYLQVLKHMEY